MRSTLQHLQIASYLERGTQDTLHGTLQANRDLDDPDRLQTKIEADLSMFAFGAQLHALSFLSRQDQISSLNAMKGKDLKDLNHRINPTDWINNGDGTWTAEAGDGAETLARDARISKEKAYNLMEQQGYGTYLDNGVIKSAVDEGDIVTLGNNSCVSNPPVGGNTSNALPIRQTGNVARTTTPISVGLGLAGEGLLGTVSTFSLSNSTGGFRPKLYRSAWRGNQYTSTFRLSNVGKVFGGIGFGVGFTTDLYGLRQHNLYGSSAPNAVSPSRFGVNTTIGVYGLLGGIGGATLSPIYFGLEAFYPGGTSQALQDKANRDTQTSNILGRPFNSANQGTYSSFKW